MKLNRLNRTAARGTAIVLAAAEILSCASPVTVYAAKHKDILNETWESGEENTEMIEKAEELLMDMKSPYDVLIKFENPSDDTISLEKCAEISQKNAKKIIEKAVRDDDGSVVEWESFFITNAIHLKTKDKSLIMKVMALPEVCRITGNGHVDNLEPVEDDSKDMMLRTQQTHIFVPDERDIEWGVSMIHADKVWEDFGINGKGTVVGIIDGGANYELPALKKKFLDYDPATGKANTDKQDDPDTKDIWEGCAYRDFVDGTDTPQKTSSDDHGTHVAGTIVGEEGEHTNRIGVAPGAKFITARAMGVDGGEVSDLIAAAEWMYQMKPDVVNNSWGGSADTDEWFKEITKAWKSRGIIPVFAAGNTSGEVPGEGTISNPANYSDVIAVAAVDQNKKIGNFSNKGPSAFNSSMTKPEISAPGVQVRSVNSKGRYVSWNGTSMAAPHVTGAVALIRAAARKYGKEEEYDELDEIRDLLMETAEPLTDAQYPESPNYAYGAGLINVYDAVSKIAGDEQARVLGTVLQVGDDKEEPKLKLDIREEAYIGRDVLVNAEISDDVSIRSAELTYWFSDEADAKTVLMSVKKGTQKDGTYSFTIPSEELNVGKLHIRVDVVDYAENKVSADADINIQKGVSFPWSEDFEKADTGLKGFIMDGCWGISHRESASEPEFPKSKDDSENTTYIGIDAGYPYFERRIDSSLYLPPVDLTAVQIDKNDPKTIPTLSVDMYNGFTGISTTKVQASFTGREDDWEDIYDVILRPDIKDRKWEHVTIPLDKYVDDKDAPDDEKINKDGRPLQIRFYFFGHDSDDGVGWYLDNLEITKGEDVAPGQVQDLRGTIDNTGLKIHFVANEESDLDHYVIERKTDAEGSSFKKIKEIEQDLDSFRFINKGEDKNRPNSHYRVEFYDDTAEDGKNYIYRVFAIDKSGNKSESSKELTIEFNTYENSVSYDLEKDESGFTHGVVTEDAADDWEWGIPEFPSDDEINKMTLLYRKAWQGLAKNKTHVFGTNLSGKASNGLDSYLLIPEFTVKKGDYLYFDSYSAMGMTGAGTEFYVEIRPDGAEGWTELVSSERVMDNDHIFTWHQIKKSLDDYVGKKVSVRFHAETSKTVWIDGYNLGWYLDNVYVGNRNVEFEKLAIERYGDKKKATASEIPKDDEETVNKDKEKSNDIASKDDDSNDSREKEKVASASTITVKLSDLISDDSDDEADDEEISDETVEDETYDEDEEERKTKTVKGSFEDLFYELIDSDHDGVLSKEEIREAKETTRDDDSTETGKKIDGFGRKYDEATELPDEEDRTIEQFSTRELNELGVGLYSEGHVPLTATITVKETGAYTKASEIDGSFALSLTSGKGGESKEYTLVISCYGFETIEKKVTVNAGDNVVKDQLVLSEAKKASIKGTVTDSEGEVLQGVSIRMDDDDRYELMTSAEDGTYEMPEAFAGKHILRFFKDGYISLQKEVVLKEGENTLDTVKLSPLGAMLSATADYGIKPEKDSEGYYKTIFFTSGVRGAAVKFQTPFKGGMLKSADIFAVHNQYFNGNHIEIGVLSYNNTGRLVELVPFREYRNLTPNEWNTIDFSEYNLRTDKPVYIVATYEDDISIADSMGVLYDEKASEKAIKHSFVYDGDFTETSTLSTPGAYGIKASWLYEEGSEKNPEAEGFMEDEVNVKPSEEEYEFDEETQTIIRYNGNDQKVNVPSKINGVTVLKIGDDAFNGTGKEDEEKIRTLILPDTLTEIGKDSFKNNMLTKVEVPEKVTKIGSGAFSQQWKINLKDQSFTVIYPEGIEEIEADTFAAAATGKDGKFIGKFPGVKTIAAGAFTSMYDVEIEAPELTEIADGAFGEMNNRDFTYPRVYTDENTELQNKDHQYLINPTVVTVKALNARDHEEVLKEVHYYGEGNTEINRTVSADKFYRMGETIKVKAPDVLSSGKSYTSEDADKEIKLKKVNVVEFYYHAYESRLRTPVLESDEFMVGFAVPNSKIEIRVGENGYKGTANADGFFEIAVDPGKAGTEISVKVNGENSYSATVYEDPEGDYCAEDGIIKRYTGLSSIVTIPNSIDGAGKITEIGDFAFYDIPVYSVELTPSIESIGTGAFMNCGLTEFGWNLEDINKAKLVYINEYAFKNNDLSRVELPELTHQIRTGAFENNSINELILGTYTSHIGDKAFKDNFIEKLTTSPRQEEIGVSAFENNMISELNVLGWMEGYEDGLTEIPADAFRGNRLNEVILPHEITDVSANAFRDNVSSGRFVIESDNENIIPTEGYDVRRSDGTVLRYQK
ncbi:S8 family serine peptidase [Oribacterium sp. WCC10]|uniref:S8 family serine peptidase n=1 Tax=Oribacterium sp. WCC10 TaxID=1855343 RepID=UPI0008E10C6A|nr:S8 family serine peptidase [Oribacterium sp. WCC10]SFG68972.1 Serine protease, subtilisin family [Oribacterium sp. WCC10]